jgi:hypothetical protein
MGVGRAARAIIAQDPSIAAQQAKRVIIASLTHHKVFLLNLGAAIRHGLYCTPRD